MCSKINPKLRKVFDKVDEIEALWDEEILTSEDLEKVSVEVLDHFCIRTFGGQLTGNKSVKIGKIMQRFNTRWDD